MPNLFLLLLVRHGFSLNCLDIGSHWHLILELLWSSAIAKRTGLDRFYLGSTRRSIDSRIIFSNLKPSTSSSRLKNVIDIDRSFQLRCVCVVFPFKASTHLQMELGLCHLWRGSWAYIGRWRRCVSWWCWWAPANLCPVRKTLSHLSNLFKVRAKSHQRHTMSEPRDS